MSYAVGVDLGGTKTAVALVSSDGVLGDVVTAPTPAAEGGEAVLDTVAALIRQIATEDVVGLGVGTAGVVDSRAGRIISSTDTFRHWVGTDVTAGLRARLGWAPGRRIQVINDVDAHAMGEYRFGAARGLESLFMVAVGTGVGGALVLDGRLRTGAHHVAGEMGHIPTPGAESLRCPCGRLGHLEAIAAGPSIERRYASRGGDRASGREIMERAAGFDDDALTVVREAAVALGKAIAGVVTVVDPAAVVIGGGVADAGPVWWQPLRDTIRGEVVSVLAKLPVLKAELGSSAALVGAAAQVFASEEK
ncbi:ROK family protein [Tessaracoccus sp. MC1865]|uniref:ROK family protein n=1 Tax=Tessaracoccus sp. MC1865 TaxID=2760310 RepID=UPI0016018A6C|nr:ROK family protein [Tessaracoccus sp. MC1865]MBB1484168.1 ROK family protein [Tessaracoccus sp. MC1865]QTO37192.1 ROK family protein [Tessaracoccus sp. MC1865]